MLTTSKKLNEVAKQLAEYTPDWKKREKERSRQSKKRSGFEHMANGISELHINLAIEEIVTSMGIEHDLNPIKHGDYTANYYFRKNRNIEAVRTTGNVNSEIDGLFVIESLPVLVEVKLSNKFSKGSSASCGKSVAETMTQTYMERVFAPIREFFETEDYGYIVVVYPNQRKTQFFNFF